MMLRKGILPLVVAAGLLGLGSAPAYADTDYYASPDGSGTACSSASPCALSEALSLTASDTGAVDIYLDPGTYAPTSPLVVSGSATPILIGANTELAQSPTQTVIDGADEGASTLKVTAAGTVDISNLTLENGTAQYGDNLAADGGGLVNVDYDVLRGGGDGSSNESLEVGSGSVDVTWSTIEGDAAWGIGVYGSGSLQLAESTVSGNATAAGETGGGVLDAGGSTGSIFAESATIADNGRASDANSAGIAIYGDDLGSEVIESTITGNGSAGVVLNTPYSSVAVDLQGDILAGNAGADCDVPGTQAGTIDDEGYNFADDGTCDFAATGSENSVSDSSIGLGPLADDQNNARTDVDTESITSSSVAHDVVPQVDCDTSDARGVPRIQSGATACDAGAFQVATPITYNVSPSGSGSACSSVAPCSLTTALNDAAAPAKDGFAVTVALASGTYETGSAGVSIDSGSEFSLTLAGAGSATTILDGTSTTTGTMNVAATFGVTVEDVTLENGAASSGASNFYDDDTSDTVTLLDDVISAGTGAPAVSVYNSVLDVDGAEISGTGGTAGISASFATLDVNDSTVLDNPQDGIDAGASNVTIADSTVTGNGSGGSGYAGVLASVSIVGIYGSTIADNADPGLEVEDASSQVTLGADLLAGNGTDDCVGDAPTDAGYNLADDSSCAFSATGSRNSDHGLDLGTLGTHGGTTQTFNVTSASDAYDVVPAATMLGGESSAFCSGNDQRGVARIQGAATSCDAGAFQYAPPIVTGKSASSLEDGLSLTLTGSRLDSVTAVTFGVATASVTNQSAGSLTVTVPNGLAAGSQPITLTNPDGTTVVSFTAISDPVLTTSSLPEGTTGSAYSQALGASGGIGPYTFSLASGSLPAGLTLSSAGVISGTPTSAQTATFSVSVTDANGAVSPATSLSLTVNTPTTTGGGGGGSTPPAPAPSIAIISGHIVIKHGTGTIELSCTNAACTGSVELSITKRVKVKKHHKVKLRTETIVVASGSYDLAAGAGGNATLTLTAAGKRDLAGVAGHSLHATATATVLGGAPGTAGVKLT